jgi:hypothetical protein
VRLIIVTGAAQLTRISGALVRLQSLKPKAPAPGPGALEYAASPRIYLKMIRPKITPIRQPLIQSKQHAMEPSKLPLWPSEILQERLLATQRSESQRSPLLVCKCAEKGISREIDRVVTESGVSRNATVIQIADLVAVSHQYEVLITRDSCSRNKEAVSQQNSGKRAE